MNVQPWEPVSYRWILGEYHADTDWNWDWDGMDDAAYLSVELRDDAMNVSLKNGQRIIVRALSDDRKAARAFNKRVKKTIEANQ